MIWMKKPLWALIFPRDKDAHQDLDAMVDMLFNHNNTPAFVAVHLIKTICHRNPNRNYIKRVAEVFIDNGDGIRGDLQANN